MLIGTKELGERIRSCRGKESREKFCDRINREYQSGLSVNTLKQWEKGEYYPQLPNVEILCKSFGYDFNTFLTTPYEEGEQRTQEYAELAEQTDLTEEGINAIKGQDPYVIGFFESLLLSNEMNRLVWEYRQCYLTTQRYAEFLKNEGLQAVFGEVYAIQGVSVADSFEEWKKLLFPKSGASPVPDVPKDEETLKAILNAFYAEKLLIGREREIEQELFSILQDYIKRSMSIEQKVREKADKATRAAGVPPYPNDFI